MNNQNSIHKFLIAFLLSIDYDGNFYESFMKSMVMSILKSPKNHPSFITLKQHFMQIKYWLKALPPPQTKSRSRNPSWLDSYCTVFLPATYKSASAKEDWQSLKEPILTGIGENSQWGQRMEGSSVKKAQDEEGEKSFLHFILASPYPTDWLCGTVARCLEFRMRSLNNNNKKLITLSICELLCENQTFP